MSISPVAEAVAGFLSFVDSTDPPGPGPVDLATPAPTLGQDALEVRLLIEAARHGDREAFGELVTMHERVVFRTALAALGSREDAEDASQEAFVVAWQKLGGFRAASTFRTWLLTIVWRKALDRRRARQLWWVRTQSTFGADGLDPLQTVTSTGADPEAHAMSRDLARRIRAAIGGLTPKLRDTFVLASSGEHSYDEIAVMLGIPLGTVKWRVSEARKAIAKRLEH